jgi:hypothetical protein
MVGRVWSLLWAFAVFSQTATTAWEFVASPALDEKLTSQDEATVVACTFDSSTNNEAWNLDITLANHVQLSM